MCAEQTKRVQAILGSLLNYARVVDNILLVILGAIAIKTRSPVKFTSDEVDHLLDYVATYPDDAMLFRVIKIQLAVHSDAGCSNENKSKSLASAHMYLSENIPIPSFNGAVINKAQIIKFVMSSAAEAELASLFITARKP